jgi:hypothetical protein
VLRTTENANFQSSGLGHEIRSWVKYIIANLYVAITHWRNLNALIGNFNYEDKTECDNSSAGGNNFRNISESLFAPIRSMVFNKVLRDQGCERIQCTGYGTAIFENESKFDDKFFVKYF